MRARAQAEGYARALPAAEGRPPFLLVVDVGHVIELYAEFTRSGTTSLRTAPGAAGRFSAHH
jgi:acyl-CoA hydrolase